MLKFWDIFSHPVKMNDFLQKLTTSSSIFIVFVVGVVIFAIFVMYTFWWNRSSKSKQSECEDDCEPTSYDCRDSYRSRMSRYARPLPGERGPRGFTGPRGLTGDVGPAGPPGADGTDGTPGLGTVIPYATGLAAVAPSSLISGAVNLPAFVGFGNSTTSATALGGSIDLTGLTDFAFVTPVAGTITDMSGVFVTTVGLNLTGSQTATLQAQLYQNLATVTDNIFTPITGTLMPFTAFSGTVASGGLTRGSLSDLNVSVAAGTRLLMVLSTTNSGFVQAVTGHFSGGVRMA